MGGIYTQRRLLKDLPNAIEVRRNSGTPSPTDLTTLSPAQTTTSYRSRGSVVGADDALALYRTAFESSWLEYSSHDSGHPFDTRKESWDLSHPLVYIKSGNALFHGPLIPRSSSSFSSAYTSFPQTIPSFNEGVYGTRAVNATIPNKPYADMANALGELRTAGGVPSVMGTILNFASRAKFVRSAGKEYLNAVFGWTPLVKDIERISGAVIRSEELVKQYLRDSGRNVRRHYDFPEEHSNLYLKSDVVLSNAFSGLDSNHSNLFNPSLGGSGGRSELVVNHNRKIWFKGAYTYYLDTGNDPLANLSKYAALARKLVGARLTPEVLWELQPWSWLVDWVFNVGQILENIEAFQTDGLVMRYGYLMITDEVIATQTVYRHGLSDRFGPVSITKKTLSKRRIRATPYGFGLNPGNFSPEQWAILVALGMTKTPTSLR